jgi:hypothetical protein
VLDGSLSSCEEADGVFVGSEDSRGVFGGMEISPGSKIMERRLVAMETHIQALQEEVTGREVKWKLEMERRLTVRYIICSHVNISCITF